MEIHEFALASVPISDLNGCEVGRNHFVAADVGIFARYIEAQSDFQALFASLKEVRINPDGSGADAASEPIVVAAEQQFAELIDRVCGVKTSESAFVQFRPFASFRGGVFWADVVVKALNETRKAVQKNIEQFDKKYGNRKRGKKHGR